MAPSTPMATSMHTVTLADIDLVMLLSCYHRASIISSPTSRMLFTIDSSCKMLRGLSVRHAANWLDVFCCSRKLIYACCNAPENDSKKLYKQCRLWQRISWKHSAIQKVVMQKQIHNDRPMRRCNQLTTVVLRRTQPVPGYKPLKRLLKM